MYNCFDDNKVKVNCLGRVTFLSMIAKMLTCRQNILVQDMFAGV